MSGTLRVGLQYYHIIRCVHAQLEIVMDDITEP